MDTDWTGASHLGLEWDKEEVTVHATWAIIIKKYILAAMWSPDEGLIHQS